MLLRLVLIGILATGFGLAQRGGGGGMGEEGGGMGGGRGGGLDLPSVPRVVNRIDIIAETLKLNKEQKKQVKTVLDGAQKDANPIHEQIVKSRVAIAEAIQSGKSQDEIQKLVGGEAALESQMARIELDAFAAIYKNLEQDQRSQSRSLFMMMKGIFDNKNWNHME
jgi:hypothetical protein